MDGTISQAIALIRWLLAVVLFNVQYRLLLFITLAPAEKAAVLSVEKNAAGS